MMNEHNPPDLIKDMLSPGAADAPANAPVSTKRKRSFAFRAFRFLVIMALCAAALTAAINAYMILSTNGQILALTDAGSLDMDCVLVLGAGLNRNDAPGPMLADRLTVSIDAYRMGAAPKLLMSGDHGRVDYDEVNTMKAVAVEQGVPSSDVFMDHAGFSTYESMYRARDIFQVKKAVIVTQHFHLNRAIYNAQRMGIEAYGIPSDLHTHPRQLYFECREYLARVKDFFWGIFQPYPTYLGEAIPVSGDGDITND